MTILISILLVLIGAGIAVAFIAAYMVSGSATHEQIKRECAEMQRRQELYGNEVGNKARRS